VCRLKKTRPVDLKYLLHQKKGRERLGEGGLGSVCGEKGKSVLSPQGIGNFGKALFSVGRFRLICWGCRCDNGAQPKTVWTDLRGTQKKCTESFVSRMRRTTQHDSHSKLGPVFTRHHQIRQAHTLFAVAARIDQQ